MENPLGHIDTLIQGPRKEFVRIIANRMVADGNIDLLIGQIADKNFQIISLEADLEFSSKALQECIDRGIEQMDVVGELRNKLSAAETRTAGNKSWATIGQVGVITFTVAIVVVSIIVLQREFK